MIQGLAAIKSRMRSVHSIRKITRAMEMVSMVKLNRVRSTLFTMRHYFVCMESMLNDFLDFTGYVSHPLLEKRPKSGRVALCLITSDTGLCSIYNQAVIKTAEAFLGPLKKEDVKLVTIGKEGWHYFKRKELEIVKAYPELHGRYTKKLSETMASDLINLFLNHEADGIFIAYTHFESTLRHRPKVEKFLNIEHENGGDRDWLILEPDKQRVAEGLIPRYLSEKFRLILLEALTSEHAARMFAMKTATDNANDLMDTLTLSRNKARQAAITKEVIEIASGAQALKE